MDNENKKLRFRNDRKKYIAEFISDNFVSEKAPNGLIKGVVMFRIWDEFQREVLGCISFTQSTLLGFVWAQPDKKHFPVNYKIELLINLLHYLPFNPARLKDIYSDCYEYRFERGLDSDREEDKLYAIKTDDSFEATFQRLLFGDEITNKKIQDVSLEIMFNHWEDNPNTNVPVEMLVSILPITEVNLVKNLKLLLDERKIHAVTSPGDPQKLISVGLEPQAIRELEGETEPGVKYVPIVKNIYGTNIENTTYGANSSIIVNVGQIKTVLETIQKEITDNPDLKDRGSVSQNVRELEAEILEGKNPGKVRETLEKIKGSANWVYQKLLNNPYVSGVIIELLMKATKT